MFRKIIKGLKDVWCGTLEFDTEPKKDSFNPVTSGGVYDAINGAGGAKEIVYFDVDPSDPPSGIHTAIGEALSKNKLPVLKIDGAVYFYTATGTDKHVFVGGYTKEAVGYTEIEVSDDDSVTSKSVDDKVFNMYMLYRTDPASPGDPPGTGDQPGAGYWICDENKHVITKTELMAAHANCRYFVLNNDIEPDSNTRKYFASVTVISNSNIRILFSMIQTDDGSAAEFTEKLVMADSEGRLYVLRSYEIYLAETNNAVLVSEPQNFDSTQKAQGRSNIGAASASDVTALQSQVSSLSDVSAYSVKGEATVAQLNAGPSGIQAGWAYQLTDSGTLTDGSLAVVAGDTVAWDGTKWFPLVKSDYYATKTYAQNVAHSIAPEFDPTRTSENPYKAGESVTYTDGKTYTFKVDHYGAWAAADVYQLDENELTEILLQKKIDGKCGKNIANKDTWNILAGHYIAYNNGSVIVNDSFSVFIIEIGEGVELAFNKNDMHIAAFSGKIIAPKETLGATAGYISGYLTSSSNRTWTTPTGCRCIAVSCYTSYLATMQIEKGTVSTQYEPYKFGVEIGDVVSLQEKLNEKLDGTVGKNLFNKDTTNKILNAYVNYATGSCYTLSNAGAYVIEIGEGVELAFNKNDIQVSAYSRVVDLTQVSTGTAVGNYLGGLNTSASSRIFTTPTNCKSIIVSFGAYSSVIGSLQVEKGDEPTSYDPYIFGIESDKVIDLNVYFVGKGHKFTTIQSAVDSVPSGSTIIIMPGTYDEAVDVVTSGKMLHIVGFNRDKCIITHPIDDYYAPPLEISKGLVENLTFVTTGATVQGLGAYCVHVDFSSEAGQALQFKNCNFKNTWRPCVGIGLRESFTLSLVGCSFESYATYSPIYCHEQQASNKVEQRLELVDCSIYNSKLNEILPAITLQETSSYTGNTATILMQRCIMKSARGAYTQQHPAIRCIDYSSSSQPSSGGGKYLDSYTWNLDYMSEMNSEAIANYSEQ